MYNTHFYNTPKNLTAKMWRLHHTRNISENCMKPDSQTFNLSHAVMLQFALATAVL